MKQILLFSTLFLLFNCASKSTSDKTIEVTDTTSKTDTIVSAASIDTVNTPEQTMHYEGVIASYSEKEYPFTFDSGQIVSLAVETTDSILVLNLYKENKPTSSAKKDDDKKSKITPKKSWDKIDLDSAYNWTDTMKANASYKLKLSLDNKAKKTDAVANYKIKITKR